MATEQLLVRLRMDATQYNREARQASQATGSVGTAAKTASTETSKLDRQIGTTGITMRTAAVAGAAVAGAAVLQFGRDSIEAASNLQESMNAVDVVFGDVAEGIHEIGEGAADSFGLSQRAFNEFATRFSGFADNIANESGREVVDIVEEITGRVADFASVHNLSLEEAGRVAQSTLAGETEVFRKFGGDVSAAAVEAKGLELGLSGVGDELTEGEKQLIRYELFMEQTNDTAGDFANTSDDLANAQRRVNANLEDAQAKIGSAVIPVLGDMASALADVLGFLNDIKVTLPNTGQELTLLGGAAKAALGVFGTISIIRDAWNEWFGDTEEGLKSTGGGVRNLSDDVEGLGGASGSSAGEVDVLAGSLAGVNDEAASDRALQRYADGIEDIDDETGPAALSTKELATAMAEVVRISQELASPIFAVSTAMQRYEEALEAANEDGEITNEEFLELAELSLDLQTKLSDLGAGNVLGGIQAIADAMDEPIEQVATMLHDMGILTDTQWQMIIGIATEVSASDRAIIRAATSQSGTTHGGSASVRDLFRHSGGPGRAGHPYVIRPDEEIFVPSGRGEFLLNDQVMNALRGLSGGRSIENTYNIPIQSSGNTQTDAQLVGAVASVLRRMEST